MGVGVLFVSELGEVMVCVSISVLGVAVCGLGEVMVYVVIRILGVAVLVVCELGEVLVNVVINGAICVFLKCFC